MRIETGRFVLRDFEAGDKPAFTRYRADPRFAALRGREAGPACDTLVDLFMSWAQERPRRNFQLAVMRKGDPPTLVGCCGLREADCPPGTAEMGIELSADAWSLHGYAVEIAQALLTFGFYERGLQSVFGLTTATNLRAARLAEWLGGSIVDEQAGGAGTVKWFIERERWRDAPTRPQRP